MMNYMSIYNVGDRVRLKGFLRNEDGTPVNPSDCYAWTYDPAGVRTTYSFGSSPELIQNGDGSFYFDINVDAPGVWRFGFWSTGNGKAASPDGKILVERSRRLLDWELSQLA